MNLTQKILGELESISLKEIENIPSHETTTFFDNDEVLGVVEDVFLKQLHTLASEYNDRLDCLISRCQIISNKEDGIKIALELQEVQKKIGFLEEWFWLSVREELNYWDPSPIYVRKGWKIVKNPYVEQFDMGIDRQEFDENGFMN